MWDGQWTKWEFAQFEESLEAKQEMEKDEWKIWKKTDEEFEKLNEPFLFGSDDNDMEECSVGSWYRVEEVSIGACHGAQHGTTAQATCKELQSKEEEEKKEENGSENCIDPARNKGRSCTTNEKESVLGSNGSKGRHHQIQCKVYVTCTAGWRWDLFKNCRFCIKLRKKLEEILYPKPEKFCEKGGRWCLACCVVKERAHEQTTDIDSTGMIDVVVLLHQQKKINITWTPKMIIERQEIGVHKVLAGVQGADWKRFDKARQKLYFTFFAAHMYGWVSNLICWVLWHKTIL